MATTTDTLLDQHEAQPGGIKAPPKAPPRAPRRRARYVWAAAAAVCAAVGATVGIIVADDSDTPEQSNRAALAHQADQYTKQLESRADAASLEFGETADHALAEKAAPAPSPVFPGVSDFERQAQLDGNARTYSKSAATRADLKDHNDQYRAWLESQDVQAERDAFVEGLLTVYGQGSNVATPSSFPSVSAIERQAELKSQPSPSSFPSVSAIEAGNRAAEQYLESQGESSSFPSVSAIERQAESADSGNRASFPSVSAIERQAQAESGSGDEFVPGSRHMPNR